MPVAAIRSGTVIPSSGASDRAAHRIASGASSAPSAGLLDGPVPGRRSSADVPGGPSRSWSLDRLPGDLVERRPEVGVRAGGVGDGLVGEQVGAGAPGGVVLGGGDQELAGRVERVGVPAGGRACPGRG